MGAVLDLDEQFRIRSDPEVPCVWLKGIVGNFLVREAFARFRPGFGGVESSACCEDLWCCWCRKLSIGAFSGDCFFSDTAGLDS